MVTLEEESKALVSLAVRNSELENLHAGKSCPICHDQAEYSHISNRQMKALMQDIVNRLYTLLKLKKTNPDVYYHLLTVMSRSNWDEPQIIPL